jgi:hypothetical protein
MSDGRCVELPRCAFTGRGYRTLGDAWLAETAGKRARERLRVARQELRVSPGHARPSSRFKFNPGGAS